MIRVLRSLGRCNGRKRKEERKEVQNKTAANKNREFSNTINEEKQAEENIQHLPKKEENKKVTLPKKFSQIVRRRSSKLPELHKKKTSTEKDRKKNKLAQIKRKVASLRTQDKAREKKADKNIDERAAGIKEHHEKVQKQQIKSLSKEAVTSEVIVFLGSDLENIVESGQEVDFDTESEESEIKMKENKREAQDREDLVESSQENDLEETETELEENRRKEHERKDVVEPGQKDDLESESQESETDVKENKGEEQDRGQEDDFELESEDSKTEVKENEREEQERKYIVELRQEDVLEAEETQREAQDHEDIEESGQEYDLESESEESNTEVKENRREAQDREEIVELRQEDDLESELEAEENQKKYQECDDIEKSECEESNTDVEENNNNMCWIYWTYQHVTVYFLMFLTLIFISEVLRYSS